MENSESEGNEGLDAPCVSFWRTYPFSWNFVGDLFLFVALICFVIVIYLVPAWRLEDFVFPEQEASTNTTKITQIEVAANWHSLTLYQLYYDSKAWKVVQQDSKKLPYYRGMCVVPGMTRPGSDDVSAPDLLPVLSDPLYQSLLCEYGAIIATANDARLWPQQSSAGTFRLRPSKWVGFESWRAKQKRNEFPQKHLPHFDRLLQVNDIPQDSVVYWGTDKTKKSFYEDCEHFHGKNCSLVYSKVFHALFGSKIPLEIGSGALSQLSESDSFLPPMPASPIGWSLYSYYVMSSANLADYGQFARAFFVTLESLYNVHDDEGRCPIDPFTYSKKLCWCFIMERLVNIWFFHSGKPAFVLNRVTGKLMDLPAPQSREMAAWFEAESVAAALGGFEKRLSGRSLALYRSLQGSYHS